MEKSSDNKKNSRRRTGARGNTSNKCVEWHLNDIVLRVFNRYSMWKFFWTAFCYEILLPVGAFWYLVFFLFWFLFSSLISVLALKRLYFFTSSSFFDNICLLWAAFYPRCHIRCACKWLLKTTGNFRAVFGAESVSRSIMGIPFVRSCRHAFSAFIL